MVFYYFIVYSIEHPYSSLNTNLIIANYRRRVDGIWQRNQLVPSKVSAAAVEVTLWDR